jgi:ubiquinone/menaquinone biosynthesis C-methylase UbiE
VSSQDFRGPIGNASEKYGAANPLVRLLLRRFLLRVDAAAAAVAPQRVLDVGCGEGVVTERLARLLGGATVLGVDADDLRLQEEWKFRRLDNLSFATGSAYELPFEDGAFDLVCAIEVLEHLERPRDALGEMARVARTALLLSVPTEPLWRIVHLLAGRNVRALGNTPGHINHWSKAAFSSLVSAYGRGAAVERVFPWTLAVVDVSASAEA